MFLPIEGLYIEALNMNLFEEIQKEYKVNIAGPTTLTAILNSLQMGFKTLAIQKKSADVFKLLGAVKNEFEKFASVLEKTQKKVTEASDELDKLVGTRTRMIRSKLRSVETLDESETQFLLGVEENG
jgi:DNA recombination protein RmuC